MRGVVAAVIGVSLALLLGGCELLMRGALGEGFNGGLPSSSPIATYAHGTATIVVAGGETIVLDQIAAGAGVDSLYGSDVRWTSSNGWNVRISGVGGGSGDFGGVGPFGGGYLTFDRLTEGQHWSSMFDDRCIVDIDVVDAEALRGSATCKGVEWFDVMDSPMDPDGPKALDVPKFDAEVTFEATRRPRDAVGAPRPRARPPAGRSQFAIIAGSYVVKRRR